MPRLLLAICACLAVVACATMGRPKGNLQLRCSVPDAVLFIDDGLAGRVSEWAPPGKPLGAGFHRVEVRHPGYFSHYAEVQLAEGQTVVVKAELRPLLD